MHYKGAFKPGQIDALVEELTAKHPTAPTSLNPRKAIHEERSGLYRQGLLEKPENASGRKPSTWRYAE